jgi:hypothetical protein
MFYKDFINNEDIEEIKANTKLYSFLAEVNHKHKLQAVQYSEGSGILLCTENGFTLGKIDTDSEGYEYYIPSNPKDRGNSYTDKRTYKSKKLSSIMKTIKDKKLHTSYYILNNEATISTISFFANFVGTFNMRLDNTLSIEKLVSDNQITVPSLISYIMNEPTKEKLDLGKCKIILDKIKLVDKIKQDTTEELINFLMNPFFIVLTDGTGDCIVGSFKIAKKEIIKRDMLRSEIKNNIETITPFSRFKNISDSEFVALTPMFKTYLQPKFNTLRNSIFPSRFITDDAGDIWRDLKGFYDINDSSEYIYSALITPC